MTLTIKQINVNNCYIELSQDKYSNVFKVSLSKNNGADVYRTILSNTYIDLKKANNCFNRYKRGAINGLYT